MIKTLPKIQHCDHLQSHLFQPSLHWPPCKQGRSWQVWKWRYDVLIIVTMIKGCPLHQNNFLFGPGICCASPISTYDAKILKIYHSQLIALDSFSCHGQWTSWKRQWSSASKSIRSQGSRTSIWLALGGWSRSRTLSSNNQLSPTYLWHHMARSPNRSCGGDITTFGKWIQRRSKQKNKLVNTNDLNFARVCMIQDRYQPRW